MSGKQARRRRVTRSEAEWRAIVQRFERSGLTRSEFCAREGVAASSLSKWRQEFGGRTRSRVRRGSAARGHGHVGRCACGGRG